jgi:hypothetical protein
MWFLLLIAAAAIYFGAHDVALAQATTPNVTPPFQGLSTPITSTVTNCMMSCNSQVANCKTGCFIPTTPTTASAGAVAELVGIDGGVVSGVINLESSGVEASDWRPRHDERYQEV